MYGIGGINSMVFKFVLLNLHPFYHKLFNFYFSISVFLPTRRSQNSACAMKKVDLNKSFFSCTIVLTYLSLKFSNHSLSERFRNIFKILILFVIECMSSVRNARHVIFLLRSLHLVESLTVLRDLSGCGHVEAFQ